ncbi:MAG TPA: hypothetical protein VLZ12_01960 [Verrucomicrobiae bacterium]|nr:hypothetical protein [Verrucomicrobiae bacterium]
MYETGNEPRDKTPIRVATLLQDKLADSRLKMEPSCVWPAEAAVPIKRIARWEFNRLLPHHPVLEDLMGEQVEWFANRARSLIGTIALTKVGRSWNFSVLRRNTLGNFQVCNIGQNFFSLSQTMVQFRYAMVAAKNNRQEVLPSSD